LVGVIRRLGNIEDRVEGSVCWFCRQRRHRDIGEGAAKEIPAADQAAGFCPPAKFYLPRIPISERLKYVHLT
jgi:hypothetical protein